MRVFVFYSQGVGLASKILPADSSFFILRSFPAVPRTACVRVPATSDQSTRSRSRLHLALEMALGLPLKTVKNPVSAVNSTVGAGTKGDRREFKRRQVFSCASSMILFRSISR